MGHTGLISSCRAVAPKQPAPCKSSVFLCRLLSVKVFSRLEVGDLKPGVDLNRVPIPKSYQVLPATGRVVTVEVAIVQHNKGSCLEVGGLRARR